MTFIHSLLLGGLLLAGIPVLIHLLMQQKPKRLAFPAFRFLVQKHRTNQRRLRLRHLLLLSLRIALIVLACLALARPRIYSERLDLTARQPVAVALVVDTSMSMQYTVAGKSRLDDARRRALELLDDLPENSRVAILDSADAASGEWMATPALARERLAGLELSPRSGAGGLSDAIGQALRLLHSLDQEPGQDTAPMPRFLYVFSDRTLASWDAARTAALAALRQQSKTPIHAAYVDVGVEQPVDLAIFDLDLPRQVIPANSRAVIRAKVQAVGKDHEAEVICRMRLAAASGNAPETVERKAITLQAGRSDLVTFARRQLPLGLHQVEISLAAPDNLPFNNVRYATFEVTAERQVLIISDRPPDAAIWKLALRVGEQKGDLAFDADVKSTQETDQLTAQNLARYQAVCLLNVAAPDQRLWQELLRYVENGGGLAILPGGEELDPTRYNEPEEARQLLPGQFQDVVRRPLDKPVTWHEDSYQPPVKDWFAEWKKQLDPPVDFIRLPPKTYRYWSVQPGEAFVLAQYADDEKRPALLERKFDRQKSRGRVLLFTTPFDGRRIDAKSDYQWNDYLTSAFYVSLAKKVISYLTDDLVETPRNHICGQVPRLPLPPQGRFRSYVLQGPGLVGQAGLISRTPTQNELTLSQAALAGHYTLLSSEGPWRTSFSMNVLPGESDLTRVPAEQIEALFGPGSILPMDHHTSLRDVLHEHWSQPVELFPWLMLVLLLLLAVENWLANRFYRKAPQEGSFAETVWK